MSQQLYPNSHAAARLLQNGKGDYWGLGEQKPFNPLRQDDDQNEREVGCEPERHDAKQSLQMLSKFFHEFEPAHSSNCTKYTPG